GDGKRLLLWGTRRPAEVWDADGQKMLHAINKGEMLDDITKESIGPPAPLSRDGSRLLTADRAAVYLWDLTHGKRIGTVKTGDDEQPLNGLLSPDEKRVLVIEEKDARARLFDIATGRLLATFAHRDRDDWKNRSTTAFLEGAVFSPDGKRLLTWGNYEKLK